MIEFRKLRDRASRIQYTLSLVLSNACLIYRSLFDATVCSYLISSHSLSSSIDVAYDKRERKNQDSYLSYDSMHKISN